MKIGLFDHIEDGARPLTTLFDVTVAAIVGGLFIVSLRAGFRRVPARLP